MTARNAELCSMPPAAVWHGLLEHHNDAAMLTRPKGTVRVVEWLPLRPTETLTPVAAFADAESVSNQHQQSIILPNSVIRPSATSATRA